MESVHFLKRAALVDALGHDGSPQPTVPVNVTPVPSYIDPVFVKTTTSLHPEKSLLPEIRYTAPSDRVVPTFTNLNIFDAFVQS